MYIDKKKKEKKKGKLDKNKTGIDKKTEKREKKENQTNETKEKILNHRKRNTSIPKTFPKILKISQFIYMKTKCVVHRQKKRERKGKNWKKKKTEPLNHKRESYRSQNLSKNSKDSTIYLP